MPTFSRTFLFMALAVSAALALDKGHPDRNNVPAAASIETRDTAIFAGGSFWCLESVFEALPGVDSATAGYTGGQGKGGQEADPNFESVSTGNSSYVEAVRVIFRPKRVSYPKLLETFWKSIDPTRADGQFSDEGAQFRTVIFHLKEDQRKAAEASRAKLSRSKRFSKPILTGIAPATVFFAAEAEHQNYYKRNAPRYQAYVRFSGREAFFKKAWGGRGKGAPAE
ncbi:MAG: peptide-methionine (S)-S-oxide reductase MsrA [Fibrobacteria bacterium]